MWEPKYKFPFELHPFQKEACQKIEEGHDVFVSVPTSGGKTLVAEYAILWTVKEMKKKVIYVSPIKSLSNEKYNEFRNKFDFPVGLLTGDNKINENADCLIVTAEILRNALYQNKPNDCGDIVRTLNTDFISMIGHVVIDEIHFMNDEERGIVWEEIIILLPPHVRQSYLSATVSHPEKFVSWVSLCRDCPMDLIVLTKRLIPLTHYIFEDNQLHEFLSSDNKFLSENFQTALQLNIKEKKLNPTRINYDFTKINKLVKFLYKNDMLQTIFFSFSRKNCEEFAKLVDFSLITHDERREIENIFDKYMHTCTKSYEALSQLTTIRQLLMKGVAFHHSGLVSIIKEIIEIVFKKGLVKILFATETFAVGVNTPTRTVVFTELTKHTNNGRRFISTAEYRQMSGRAGRKGLDNIGHVILLPVFDFPDETELKSVVFGHVPEIRSRFKWNYQIYLKLLQASNIDLNKFVDKSLANRENNVNIELMMIDLEKLIKEHNDIIDEQLTPNDKNIIECVLKWESIVNDGVITLNKKQQKEYSNGIKKINENDQLKSQYSKIQKKKTLQRSINLLERDIDNLKKTTEISSQMMIIFLEKWNYIDSNGIVKLKGMIAPQINECNSILLTEIIMQDLLIGLSHPYILAILSLFTDPIRGFKGYNYVKHENFDKIQKIADDMKKSEMEIFNTEFTNWNLSYDYTHIAFKWGSNCNIKEILEILYECGEYEGNFVKNMLKLYNIINDIIGIGKMIKKFELVKTLEGIESVILREIVSVKSLYFS